MTRELLIFRHGRAVAGNGADDFSRPIKDSGKRGCQRMGSWLWQKNIRPDYIITSPAERAYVSTHKLCKAMGMDTVSIELDRRLYRADLNTLLTVLAECPGNKRRVLLVGHNPGLSELLMYLLAGKAPVPDDGKLLPTATLARLVMPDNWKQIELDSAQLKSLTRPDDLPKKFPYPAPDGKEKRDRPAYYYRQSAVIPYRMHKKSMQIMLIGSSKRNHWVVPKGIHEPGLSARKSAAREAYEEAGIRGTVSKSMLGKYVYTKWGANCNVEVYAMRVREVLADSEWEETHRGRKWVSIDEAIDQIKEPSMRPMIQSLAEFTVKEA